MTTDIRLARSVFRPRALLPAALLLGGLMWACWPRLREMGAKWSEDPRYSHGFLVPAFAAFLLWHRRDLLEDASIRPSWWGVAVLGIGAAIKLAGAYYYVDWLDDVAIVAWAAGVALTLGGLPMLRWAWPSAAFLVFMVPLPYRVEQALGAPLQRIATIASTFSLQTLGLTALAEGNVIRLVQNVRVGVAEACNGLGMLMMFLAYATAAALIVRRPLADRVLIVLSAVPIAVFANILRITVTGWLYVVAGKQLGDAVYHDLAGWLMMPLALGCLWLEFWFLDRLFIASDSVDAAVPIWKAQLETGVHAVKVQGARSAGRRASS